MLIARMTFAARLSSMAKPRGRCWPWPGTVTRRGYGQVKERGRVFLAHRRVYEHLIGPVPPGCDVHHLCHNKSCVNPSHLQPIRPSDHIFQHPAKCVENAAKTHCKYGHEFSPA